MSIEAGEPQLSKEEKKARKEEKKKRREAKAAKAAGAAGAAVGGGASAVGSVEASAGPSTAVSSINGDAIPVKGLAAISERKEKKDKKDKKDKKRKALETTSSAVTTTTPTTIDEGIPKQKKSKKDKTQIPVDNTVSSSSTMSNGIPKPLPRPFDGSASAYLAEHNITIDPPLYPPTTSIPTLPVQPGILSWLADQKFKNPTPIQACAWPALLAGKDLVGVAETGSGKTLGFGVPGIHLLSSSGSGSAHGAKSAGKGKGKINLLVLAPTRELALQSHETLEALGGDMGIGSVCLYGGVGKDEQRAAIRQKETRVVVGTPGRVLDLADSEELDLGGVTYLVLDEADRMLDQGFENDIRRIIAHCPPNANRQTVMFSATWPESVRRLAGTFLKDPIRVTVGSDELSANKRIEQVVEVLDQSFQKDARMLHHLRTHLKAHPSSAASPTRILVFALYKKEAQRLEGTIRRNFSVAGLHGDMGQNERFKALDKFKKGEVNVLVATDVAARGLDIPDVGLVINVTFPLTTEDFVHRCGRTGRAGKSGKAVTFFTGENHERSLAGELVRVLRDVGADVPKEMDRFPQTIKKKEHGSYGAFYKDISNAPAPTKITFD